MKTIDGCDRLFRILVLNPPLKNAFLLKDCLFLVIFPPRRSALLSESNRPRVIARRLASSGGRLRSLQAGAVETGGAALLFSATISFF
jgi:hypothetical protein